MIELLNYQYILKLVDLVILIVGQERGTKAGQPISRPTLPHVLSSNEVIVPYARRF